MTPNDLAQHPKYSIIRCLMDENREPWETWRAYNVYPHEVSLSKGVAAFVYRSRKGRIHIFIDESVNSKHKLRLLGHELKHVIEDMPNLGRVIGVDMQYKQFEVEADLFVGEVAAAFAATK